MILHTLVVENWRCILGERSVGPFSEGVNILHAPNATGKSTLFEALRCALMDNHNTKGEEIQKLRPWGRALSPRVVVEFSTGGVRYRVRKGFLDTPESLLERLEKGTYQPVAKGPEADKTTRALFTKDAPKKGMSRPEHWGVQQLLWAPQGGLELGELSGNLLDDIRTSITAQVVDDRARGVEELLKKRYETYFTPTGKVSKNSALTQYEQAIRETAAELEARRMEHAEAESLSKRVRALSEKAAALGGDVGRMEAETNALEEKVAAYEKMRAEFDLRSAGAHAAEAGYGRLKTAVEQIDDATKERDVVKKRIEELRSALPQVEADRKECAKALEAAQLALEAAREGTKAAEERANQARAAHRAVELKEQCHALVEKDAAVKTTQTLLSEHEKEKASGHFPSLAEIKKIRKAFADLEKAKIQLDASRISLEITPASALSGRIDAGDSQGPLTLEAGKPTTLHGAPEIRLDIESFGVLRAFGPCESAQEALEDARKAEAHIQKLSAPFGTNDRTDLEELHERGSSLDSHIDRERAELNALLGKETAETLSARLKQIDEELHALLDRFAGWKEHTPDPKELAAAAEEGKRNAEERLHAAETARDAASKASSEKEMELKLAEQTIKSEEKSLESLEERLRTLQNDGKTQEERRTELTALALSWDAAKARVKEYGDKLKEFGGDPVQALKKQKGALQAKSGELKTTEEEHIRESARLETFAARGLYTVLAGLEEKLAQLEEQRGREQRTADSIRLLYETFTACRSEMAEAVTRTASERATELFARISGAEGGRLVLADSMRPSGFVPAELDRAVDVDALSGGEKEQLHFAVRMALADCSGREERRLLVLDDTLMATDGIRFPRVLDIIEEAAEELQILILTCQPERFEPLANALRIDLGALLGRTA